MTKTLIYLKQMVKNIKHVSLDDKMMDWNGYHNHAVPCVINSRCLHRTNTYSYSLYSYPTVELNSPICWNICKMKEYNCLKTCYPIVIKCLCYCNIFALLAIEALTFTMTS